MESLIRHILQHRGGALRLLLLPALLLMAACGDSTGNFNGPIDNVLRVISINPSNGATFVDPSQQIQIRVSLPIATSTVNGLLKISTIGVNNAGTEIPVSISFAEGDTVIVATAAGGIGMFGSNMQYKVDLLQGVQAITGQPLSGVFTSFFSTGQGTGVGSTAIPGVAPTVTSWIPDSGTIWYCPGGSQTVPVTVIFSECVAPDQLAANLEVTLFGAPIYFEVYPTFDERRFDILVNPFLQIGNLKIKVRAGMQDCTGDTLAHDSTKNYTLFCM